MNTTLPVASDKVLAYNALRDEYRKLMHELNTSTSACSNILNGIDDWHPNGTERVAKLQDASNFIAERQSLINRLNEIITRLDYLILIEKADVEAAQFNFAYWDAFDKNQRAAQ
jgi:hypothetical protein